MASVRSLSKNNSRNPEVTSCGGDELSSLHLGSRGMQVLGILTSLVHVVSSKPAGFLTRNREKTKTSPEEVA